MVRMSKSVEYALISLSYMAQRRGVLTRSREVSCDLSLPPGLIAKVLQRLAAAGLIASEQGSRGGYRLLRDPDSISFLELSEAVDGPFHFAPCDDPVSCDRRAGCTVAGPVREMEQRVSSAFAAVSVGELLGTRGDGA